MKTFKGKVEIYNASGRVHYPISVQASNWKRAAYLFMAEAEKIYKTNRRGKRDDRKSVTMDLTPLAGFDGDCDD